MARSAVLRVFFAATLAAGCGSLLGINGDYVLDDSLATTDREGGTTDEDGGQLTGDGGPIPVDPSCVPAPNASPEAISETCGIFVSPNGDDTNLGTRQSPVRTIKQGMFKAIALNKRVYVCDALYDEQVAPPQAVEIFGGFACPDPVAGFPTGEAWTYLAATAPRVAPTTAGQPALLVKGITAGAVRIEDMEFVAGPTDATNVSSIAAVAVDSQSVKLTHVKLVSADGRDGTTIGGPAAPAGPPADAGAPGTSPVTCPCPNGGVSVGGEGGCTVGGTGQPSYTPASPTGATGAGGGSCKSGTRGSDAPNGTNGDAGAPGTIVGDTLVLASGYAGTAGLPGQGGGGAGCGPGGGGCGGCGGGGGPAGAGGGASIGLLARDAVVEFTASVITTGKGGAGGAGLVGAAGNPGAKGVPPASTLCGGALPNAGGGAGGKGGNGGAGGGGAGGDSACIIFKGTAPVVDDPTRTLCKHGTGGTAGASPSRPGAAGRTDVTVELQ
jgi:hypothetical protein